MPIRPRPPRAILPLPIQHRSSDEFAPLAWAPRDRRVAAELLDDGPGRARRLGRSLEGYFAGRTGTAASLLALNRAWGRAYYDVPDEAAADPEAAEEALGGEELVIDVQTHYVAADRTTSAGAEAVLHFLRTVAPDRWRDVEGPVGLSLADFLRCVYVESETAVAVLTAAPGEGRRNILSNDQIAGTRELLDRFSGSGRLLHHAIVHPNLEGELEGMEALRDRFRPDGWKVYTLYGGGGGRGFRLDDETTGRPFLERCVELGVKLVCAHKGLSELVPTGSPEDIGPAAAAFPDIDFLVYHSGYEVARGGAGEGPFTPAVSHLGTNRLVASLERAGIAPGANVYAELGSTWFLLVRRPREAVHVLGKLLRAVGEDNILWGTDSVWYGSPQPLIDAFRSFRIPADDCARYGYPPLTARAKAKILGENAARVYGVDAVRARETAVSDDLGWVRAALAHDRERGSPSA